MSYQDGTGAVQHSSVLSLQPWHIGSVRHRFRLEALSTGVISPTIASAMSWIRHIFMHFVRSILGSSEGGQSIDMRDMRYMWSEMDSPLFVSV